MAAESTTAVIAGQSPASGRFLRVPAHATRQNAPCRDVLPNARGGPQPHAYLGPLGAFCELTLSAWFEGPLRKPLARRTVGD